MHLANASLRAGRFDLVVGLLLRVAIGFIGLSPVPGFEPTSSRRGKRSNRSNVYSDVNLREVKAIRLVGPAFQLKANACEGFFSQVQQE